MEVSEIVVEKLPVIKIPEYLVYEVMDGKPIPYRGFQEVLNSNKNLEDIMGSSGLQSFIITDVLLRFLFKCLPEEYAIMSNELGLHLSKKNNLATDIGIYRLDTFQSKKPPNKYLETPPLVAIEVDTKADMSQFANPMDYFHRKTRKLLGFGIERVIWFATDSEKVMVATADQDWIISDWNKPITILPNVVCNLADLLAKRGIK